MKTFYMEKTTTCFYSALIEAESYEKAKEIMMEADLDDCFVEESCSELYEPECQEIDNPRDYDLPIFIQTADGYEIKE